MSDGRDRLRIFFPIILAIMVVIGIFIGSRLDTQTSNHIFSLPASRSNQNKLNEILNYIEEEYVDTISRKQLTERAIQAFLENLDPHSAYIPAEEFEGLNEPLEGNFDGIGIEFKVLEDTLMVVSVIPGGPSEAVGLKPGDRIIKVEEKLIAGVKIKDSDVLKLLRGKSNTKVNITVLRRGVGKPLPFTITRGKIPIHSVDAAFMVDAKTGYIRISRFAANTFQEYLDAFDKLRKQNVQKLILDLRGNPGGYLTAAISLADEFLENGKMIVYTEGKARPKETYKATVKGQFEKNDLVVLIDEGSASASEILAGAVQDNDRAIVVGRRSFGKGLVQEQVELPDGSAMRLTIARYYTPTGRSIQKPYNNGIEDYYGEELERYERGELLNKDSIHFTDSLKFTTPKGKIVYGGGGIMPDIFVPIDSTNRTEYLTQITFSGVLNQFALDYADRQRSQLQKFKSFEEFSSRFSVDQTILNQLANYAERNGIKKDSKGLIRSTPIIKTQIKAYIARSFWGNNGFYQVYLLEDNAFKVAMEQLKSKS